MIEKKKCTYGLFYCLYELIKYVPNLIWSMYSFLYIIVEYMCVHVCVDMRVKEKPDIYIYMPDSYFLF